MGVMYLLYARILGSGSAALFLLVYTLPVYLGSVYFTTQVTIPRALLTRRYWRTALYVLYTVLGVLFLLMAFFLLLIVRIVPVNPLVGPVLPRSGMDIIVLSTGVFIVTLMASVVTLLRHWYDADLRARRLTEERLRAELTTLRAQVHPHFLFNTLNNLYALTLRKSDRAPDIVLKLSEVLDYMLDESRADLVSIEREARLLEQYLDLERIRHGERVRIDWECRIDVPRQIPPLLLLPLVENSFKHGVGKDSGASWVEILLETTREGVHFRVRNSVPPRVVPEPAVTQNGGGLGLRNVRSRLALLYPEEHVFEAGLRDGVYEADIRIPTSRIETEED